MQDIYFVDDKPIRFDRARRLYQTVGYNAVHIIPEEVPLDEIISKIYLNSRNTALVVIQSVLNISDDSLEEGVKLAMRLKTKGIKVLLTGPAFEKEKAVGSEIEFIEESRYFLSRVLEVARQRN